MYCLSICLYDTAPRWLWRANLKEHNVHGNETCFVKNNSIECCFFFFNKYFSCFLGDVWNGLMALPFLSTGKDDLRYDQCTLICISIEHVVNIQHDGPLCITVSSAVDASLCPHIHHLRLRLSTVEYRFCTRLCNSMALSTLCLGCHMTLAALFCGNCRVRYAAEWASERSSSADTVTRQCIRRSEADMFV